ncbi:MAG: helix-turn-helix transcriptional regulator [Dysgonomonas sp.]|nr:helix-turn-helix transcriptional regulator [Dysgonomonas sp.]
MNIVSTLNEKLLQQPFAVQPDESVILAEYRNMASMYARLENSIAVLSDLKSDKSYIYNGGVAEALGIAGRDSNKEIDSIWEEEIFSRIHPDDLMKKHMLELQFFHFLKSLPSSERPDYHITSRMRMMDMQDEYIVIHHRMFYVCNDASGTLWLSLCLYNYSYEKTVSETMEGIIVNSRTGDMVKMVKEKCNNILSQREKEILLLIEKGRMSKDIAEVLSISKNTVDRHRQNILEKLRVKNSLEACRVAKLMDLL